MRSDLPYICPNGRPGCPGSKATSRCTGCANYYTLDNLMDVLEKCFVAGDGGYHLSPRATTHIRAAMNITDGLIFERDLDE